MKKIIAIILLGFSCVTSAAQRVDDQCQIGGCSRQICANVLRKEDDGIATTCEYKNYYECFKISNCVVNKSSNACGWEQSPGFLSCLKEKKAPNSVIQRYTESGVIRLLIQLANQG